MLERELSQQDGHISCHRRADLLSELRMLPEHNERAIEVVRVTFNDVQTPQRV